MGDYSFNAHAVGTDPDAITVNAAVTLHVVDFNLTAPSPDSLTVAQGGTSGASTFQVTASGSFSGTVALSCPAGLPAGATCVFSPSSTVSPTSSSPVTVTLTVTAGAGTPVGGPVTVTLSAMTAGAPAAKTQTFSLTVTGVTPDFKIAVTATPNVTLVNQNVSWNGTLTAINGYSGKVALSCTAGAPATCVVTPPTLTPTPGGAGFTVTLGSATASTFEFAIQGTDGTLTHATPTETLTVGTDVEMDGHGQCCGHGPGWTERQLYVFGGSGGGRDFQLGGEFWVRGLASVGKLRVQSGVDFGGGGDDHGDFDDYHYWAEFGN